jgi:SOS-response transcriptional repressor LexA
MRDPVRNMALLKRTYDTVFELLEEKPYNPTFREVALKLGCVVSTAHEHLRSLKQHGYIDFDPTIPRSIRIVKPWPAESTGEVA